MWQSDASKTWVVTTWWNIYSVKRKKVQGNLSVGAFNKNYEVFIVTETSLPVTHLVQCCLHTFEQVIFACLTLQNYIMVQPSSPAKKKKASAYKNYNT